jgi:outer membrane protein
MMKKSNFLRIVLLSAGITMITGMQGQKIAHLSFDSLVSMMPETKTAMDAAQNYFKGLEQESLAMQTELESKYKDYMEKEAGMSELLKKNKQEDLQQLQARIQDFQRKAEMDYKQKQADLTAPIYQKAKKGIDAVAKEGGYKYVLDTSPQNTTVLYNEGSDDILMLVKKKLDSMPAAEIPGTMPPGTGGNKAPPTQGGTKAPSQKPGK